jgi:hypothetical protein
MAAGQILATAADSLAAAPSISSSALSLMAAQARAPVRLDSWSSLPPPQSYRPLPPWTQPPPFDLRFRCQNVDRHSKRRTVEARLDQQGDA